MGLEDETVRFRDYEKGVTEWHGLTVETSHARARRREGVPEAVRRLA
jgi:hypothetical protein